MVFSWKRLTPGIHMVCDVNLFIITIIIIIYPARGPDSSGSPGSGREMFWKGETGPGHITRLLLCAQAMVFSWKRLTPGIHMVCDVNLHRMNLLRVSGWIQTLVHLSRSYWRIRLSGSVFPRICTNNTSAWSGQKGFKENGEETTEMTEKNVKIIWYLFISKKIDFGRWRRKRDSFMPVNT